MRPFFLAGIVVFLLGDPVAAGPLERPEGTDSLYKAIAAAGNGREKALLHKQLGDLYASREEYGKAAEEFVQALSLAPSSFTLRERLQMAISISWAGRYDEAAGFLRSILEENPEDRDARIHLAKVLSWSNKLQEAGTEADRVLQGSPENQDALLVKANTLRWQGDARASIPVYEKALAQGESFDARVGLAYAYLDSGEKEAAKEVSRTLKPLHPYQEKELSQFSEALCGVRAPHAGIQFSHYGDSDSNRVDRTSLSYGLWAGKWDTALTYQLTTATDPLRRAKADEVRISAHGREGRFDAGVEAGISRTEGGSVFVGRARAETDAGWGTIGVSAAREALSDTAELIENRIVRTSGAISLAETVSPRLTFSESYTRFSFSDDNSADDLLLNVRYALTAASPKIATGYRFRYWDFRRQSGGGYFDPEGFVSHQLFVSLVGEKDGFFARLEPYGGYQSYTRYGEKTSGAFFGIPLSAGWTMKKCTAFEMYGEGGNYAGGTVAGYKYYQVGFRLTVFF